MLWSRRKNSISFFIMTKDSRSICGEKCGKLKINRMWVQQKASREMMVQGWGAAGWSGRYGVAAVATVWVGDVCAQAKYSMLINDGDVEVDVCHWDWDWNCQGSSYMKNDLADKATWRCGVVATAIVCAARMQREMSMKWPSINQNYWPHSWPSTCRKSRGVAPSTCRILS